MTRQACQVCGRCGKPDDMVQHHIVPVEVTAEAGIPESQTTRLCVNCHREAHSWYRTKVALTTYDPGTKRFRPRSGPELVREYHSAFSSFLNYKAEQGQRTAQP